MTTQNNIFKPTFKFSRKTSVSNVNVSNDHNLVCLKLEPRIRVKIDSTVASTGTTQIVDLHRGLHTFVKQSCKVCIAQCCLHIAHQSPSEHVKLLITRFINVVHKYINNIDVENTMKII